MGEFNCPYCGEKHEPSDGPYEEDKPEEWGCSECGKPFFVSVTYHASYSTTCAESEHTPGRTWDGRAGDLYMDCGREHCEDYWCFPEVSWRPLPPQIRKAFEALKGGGE